MSRTIWNQCRRKCRYRDEHTANLYRKSVERKSGKRMDYYWCNYCNGFHLTSAVESVNVKREESTAYAI